MVQIKETERRSFPCRGVLWKSEHAKDQWVAHCLDFDVVTQGDSPEHASEMLHDAVAEVLIDDLNNDFDPYSRCTKDEEDWDRLSRIVENGVKRTTDEILQMATENPKLEVVVFFEITLCKFEMVHERTDRSRVPDVQIAA